MPEQGSDRGTTPDPGSGSGGGVSHDAPTWMGPAAGSEGGAPYQAAPGGYPAQQEFQAAPPQDYRPGMAPGYQADYQPGMAPGYQADYQPGMAPGYQADYQPGFQPAGGQAWYPDQGAPSGFGAPPGPPGYDPPGYEPPAPPGYQPPGSVSGYQVPASPPGFDAPDGSPGYQSSAWQGYQDPGVSSGYEALGYPSQDQGGTKGFPAPPPPDYYSLEGTPGQPDADYRSAAPMPGDVAAPAATTRQPPGWGPGAPSGSYPGAQPQQGYPGAQGVMWPGPSQPQARQHRGLLIGIVALVAAAVAAAVTSVVLLSSKGESPTAMALQAGQAIAPAAGVTLNGTFDNASANLTVTKAGSVVGSYSQEAFPATRITINGVTYLKVPAGFWNLQPNIGGSEASQAGGNWAKAPPGDVTSFASFVPAQISRVLEHVGNQPRAVDATLGGTKVIKLSARGNSYYITTATPNHLVRIDGTLGGASYAFDIKPLTATTIAPVYTLMHTDVQALQGAQDPEASLTSGQNINFSNDCSTSDTSCTVSVNVTVTDPSSATVLVTMNAAFSATKGGTAFGNCTATVPANTDNSTNPVTVTPQCALTGPAWKGWVDSQTSTFTTWVSTTFGAEVNSATDISALQATLTQQQGS